MNTEEIRERAMRGEVDPQTVLALLDEVEAERANNARNVAAHMAEVRHRREAEAERDRLRIERDAYGQQVRAVEAERDRLRATLLADIEQIKREASDEPYREPDHLEDLLGIDPNDTADRLAARAIEYQNRRKDTARRAEKAEAQVEAVRALAEKFERWPSGPSYAVTARAIRAALDAT